MSVMKRREFITLLGSAAAAWPLAARAQQGERVRRIGLLMGVADDREGQARVTALKQGLQELGWTDGRNIQIEVVSIVFKSSDNRHEMLSSLAQIMR
jgi:putative ABC transport system substrate-binding protein